MALARTAQDDAPLPQTLPAPMPRRDRPRGAARVPAALRRGNAGSARRLRPEGHHPLGPGKRGQKATNSKF